MNLILSFVLGLNIISALIIIPYPINLLFLALSSKNWEDPSSKYYYHKSELPMVSIQFPVFNEPKIISTTLKNVENIKYPLDRLKIQILDDSTDETSEMIDNISKKLIEKGFLVDVVRRSSRNGFKAGALRYGLKQDDSEFVAIFDSDFQINPNFLMQSIHYFKNNVKIGAVQSRWGHSNLNYSLFTRSMSIGLDGHFLVEKIGRKKLGAFISFNGTGGIWRRKTIDESGGWKSDTLAEDLDLAYRAQLIGYEIIYLKSTTNLQEIPPTLRCWIIQQSRWAKGFSQNIKKNLKKFLAFSFNSPGWLTIQGTIHLTQYLVPLMIIVNTVTTIMLIYTPSFETELFSILGLMFTFSTVCGIIAYSYAINRGDRSQRDIFLIPLFLFWGAGLVIRMGVGVIDGFMRKGGVFERTPKYNISTIQEDTEIKKRENIPLDKVLFLEILYIFVLLVGILKTMVLSGFYFFHTIYFAFLLLSTLNLVISEVLHARSN
jgi:cellulose synthase/poly-beta-1,6-N-acetylglucosamine synthase-like glycosyltransferase